ncbi:CRISPR-associated endonuclease/helicase Cas3 [bacterium HR10]|nr:CRISPR-associated endonuclease/helicase Cas3 [bacterium HR10]
MADLLAKPDVGLLEHLAEVTRLGAEIARRMGLSEELRMKALLACAFHDTGKATRSFQEHMRAARALEEAKARGAPSEELEHLQHIANRKKAVAYPHALASLPFVLMAEGLLKQRYGWAPQHLEATAAVLTHHSPLSPTLYKGFEKPDYELEALPEALEALWRLLESYDIEGLPPADAFWHSLQPFLATSPAALLEEPLLVGEESQKLRGILRSLSPQSFAQVKAVLHLADWLASAKTKDAGVMFLSAGSQAVHNHVGMLPAPLRAFQRGARDTRSDTLWLRAPTGTGKTEALLLWAGDAERLIYLLPTQATTNAMWRRLQKIYGEERVGLAHGRASYMLRQEADEDLLDARLFGAVFARPVTVATLDQYLLAHLHGRHWEERRSLVRRATLVLDEIHAYEPYTLGLLLEALKRESPGRLALASATLPEPLLELFPRGELVEAEPELWRRCRHRLELREGALLEEGLEEALRFAREGRSVLVVANTIRDAQTFYERLAEAGWERRALLHARFTFRDRQEKEARVSCVESGLIFVATQVVEVSLDISYEVLLTEIAPVDALVQRMGRVNRRGEAPPAPVLVYTSWGEGSRRVYGQEMLSLSREILSGLPSEPTDGELSRATHELYRQVIATPDWQEELRMGQETLAYVQKVLGCYTIDLADEELRERFTTRRGVVSVEVLPAQFVEEAYRLREQGEGWRIPELLVPVPLWWFRVMPEAFRAMFDLGIAQASLPYDAELGLQIPVEGAAFEEGVIVG